MNGRIAVIVARADASEQRNLFVGIATAAFSHGYDVSVFSNIYNHWANDKLLNFENVIYDFFEPSLYDGVIISAESFMDMSILEGAVKKMKEAGTPCVVIDGSIDGFLSMCSDDSDDLEHITDHLICGHGFKDIDVLACKDGGYIAKKRLEGVLRSFARNGIEISGKKIFRTGNFWDDSGKELANRYISGEIPLPQAVICLNDYMAFGLCKALTDAGIDIPGQVTVTGYDSSEERILHYPFLTSCRRDRQTLGAKAVEMVTGKRCLMPKRSEDIIFGLSCPCGLKSDQMRADVDKAFAKWDRTVLSSFLQFSGSLTACRTLSEYTSVLSEYFYMLYGVDKFSLCLDRAWSSPKFSGDEFLYFEIDGGGCSMPETVKGSELLSRACSGDSKPAMYFFSPLYCQMRLFGYTVQKFYEPGSYDFSFLDWSKTAANTLEFLRMKNDIDYLTQCQRVSELYDALTGFYNLSEFRRIVDIIDSDELSECVIYAARLHISEDSSFVHGENYRNEVVSAAASALKKSAKAHEVFCRAEEDLFLVLSKHPDVYFLDRMKAMVCYGLCSKEAAMSADVSFREYRAEDLGSVLLDESSKEPDEMTSSPHYKALLQMRVRLYSDPRHALSKEQAAKTLCLSSGHFSTVYKKCVGASYNNDCIKAKIMLAKYLLCTTVMSIYAVASSCGYTDEKYFARQFKQYVGCSPMQYRDAAC